MAQRRLGVEGRVKGSRVLWMNAHITEAKLPEGIAVPQNCLPLTGMTASTKWPLSAPRRQLSQIPPQGAELSHRRAGLRAHRQFMTEFTSRLPSGFGSREAMAESCPVAASAAATCVSVLTCLPLRGQPRHPDRAIRPCSRFTCCLRQAPSETKRHQEQALRARAEFSSPLVRS